MSKWVDFLEAKDTGKTKVWNIQTKEGNFLGTVSWFSHWRQYCFFPSRGTIWNAECLEEVTTFIREQMEFRKVKNG